MIWPLKEGKNKMTDGVAAEIEYFRGDASSGITPPNLLKECTFAEHIVRARGKRDKFTSVSLSPSSIRCFGDTLWQLKCKDCITAGHTLVEHPQLLSNLQEIIKSEVKADRARAIQALRYAKTRKEGLIDWQLGISSVDRKELENWTALQVRPFFSRR